MDKVYLYNNISEWSLRGVQLTFEMETKLYDILREMSEKYPEFSLEQIILALYESTGSAALHYRIDKKFDK